MRWQKNILGIDGQSGHALSCLMGRGALPPAAETHCPIPPTGAAEPGDYHMEIQNRNQGDPSVLPKRRRRRRKQGRQLLLAYAIRSLLLLGAALCVALAIWGVRLLMAPATSAEEQALDTTSADGKEPQTGGELAPAEQTVQPRGLTVVLDPGHGGGQPGCVIGDLEEKDIAMSITKRLKEELERLGFDVVLTRSTDADVDLSERARIANEAEGDCFVSIHCNSYEDDSVSGLECFYFRSEEGQKLAELISKATAAGEIDTREVKEGNFQVLRETDMPSVLVEVGYMTNPRELTNLASQPYQENLAHAIADGIVEMMEGKPA